MKTLGEQVEKHGISEGFLAVAQMFCRLSGDVIKGRTHDHEFGPWRVFMNGTTDQVTWNPDRTMGAGTVAPISVAILYNGWLAGILSPAGGWIAAGEGANEDSFIAACGSVGGPIAGVK